MMMSNSSVALALMILSRSGTAMIVRSSVRGVNDSPFGSLWGRLDDPSVAGGSWPLAEPVPAEDFLPFAFAIGPSQPNDGRIEGVCQSEVARQTNPCMGRLEIPLQIRRRLFAR